MISAGKQKFTVCIVALIAMKSTKHWLRKKLFRRLRTLRNTGNIARDREAKLKEIENLPDYVFRSMFRMSKDAFTKLVQTLELKCPHLTVAERSRRFAECNVKGKKGIPLSLKTKVLAISLGTRNLR